MPRQHFFHMFDQMFAFLPIMQALLYKNPLFIYSHYLTPCAQMSLLDLIYKQHVSFSQRINKKVQEV